MRSAGGGNGEGIHQKPSNHMLATSAVATSTSATIAQFHQFGKKSPTRLI